MRNHVNTVLGLIERNASNEAIEYIKEVDKRTSDFEKIRYTDNVALDSILTSKINLAKEKGINVKLDMSDKEFNAMVNCSNPYMMDDTGLWEDVHKVLEREVYGVLQEFYTQCRGKVVVFYPLDFEEDCPSTGFYLLKEGYEFWLRAKYEVFKEVIKCK